MSKAKRNCMRVTQAIIALLGPQRKDCKTLTFDNGKECAEHEFIAQCLTAKVCFAHPNCSLELGLNENHNALLRQFFPKQTNLLKVSQDQVNDAVYSLNHRPRKRRMSELLLASWSVSLIYFFVLFEFPFDVVFLIFVDQD